MTSTWDVCNASEPAETFVAADHAVAVARDAARRIEDKYLRGQQEHGGHLPRKAGLLAHAEAEGLDLVIYQHAIREQLESVRSQAVALAAAVDKLLGEPE